MTTATGETRYEAKAEDVPHEEEVLRNPFSLRSWWRYLTFKKDSPPSVGLALVSMFSVLLLLLLLFVDCCCCCLLL
jgi:hypothetical protein